MIPYKTARPRVAVATSRLSRCLVLFFATVLVASAQNLLTNGDFSQVDTNGKPLSWTMEDSTLISLNSTDHPSGYSQSLSVALPTTGGSALGYVLQAVAVASSGAPLTPNSSYAARVWLKSSVSGQAELQVKRYSAGVEVDRPTSTTSTTGWSEVTVGFDTNPSPSGQIIDQVQVLLRYKKNAAAGQVAKFAGAELLDSANSTIGTFNPVATFESISVDAPINGALAPAHSLELSYRPTGTTPWLPAMAPQRSTADNDFRGSVMLLQPNSNYDVQAVLKLNGTAIDTKTATVTTWDDHETYDASPHVQPASSSSTLTISGVTGSAGAWAHYFAASGGSTVDVGSNADYAVYIANSSYVVIDGLTIKGGRINAVYIYNSDHIRLRNCDISGWSVPGEFGKNTSSSDVKYGYFTGTPYTSGSGGTLIIERAGVHITGSGSHQVVIERNLIHDPQGKSASWAIDDGNANDNHPAGPSGIILDETGGNNVVRDNDIIAGDGHRFNDVIEGNQNGNPTGGPSLDTDISGNLLSSSNDDGTELDGGQKNVRYWHNWVDGTHSQISTVPVLQGPSYVFKNVFVGGDERGTTEDGFKMGGASGTVHFVNNTVFSQNYGFSGGHSEGPTTDAFTRNNIFSGPVPGNGLLKFDKSGSWTITGDFDYDLIPVNGINATDPTGKETNAVAGYPNFDNADQRSFLLLPGSPGIAAGTPVPNLTPAGVANPDLGAIDVNSATTSFPPRTATPDVFPRRSVVRLRTGTTTTTALQLNAPTTTGSTWRATVGSSWLSLSAATGSTGATPQSITCTIDATGLTVGTHRTFVSWRTDTGALRTVLIDVEVEPATDISFVMEAEDGLPSGGFEEVTDATASGGAYAQAYSGGTGSIRQDFTVATAGYYYVHARVRVDGPASLIESQNSFNLHIDNTSPDLEWDLASVGTDWSWDTAHVVPATITSDVTGPIYFAAGAHYLDIAKREAGAQLDVIVVSNSPYPPRVATPAFSPGGGTYSSAPSVTITSATTGATIRYTTDNSLPSETHGTVYSGAVSLSATTLLRAIAYKDQMQASPVASDLYTLSGSGGAAFEMSANQVVMEAEHYTSKSTGTDDWTLLTDANASGGASNNALQSLPNDGTGYATLDPNSAHVDYQIDVPSGAASSFYVHIRDYGATSTDDSVYVSIDGNTSTYYVVSAGRTLDWASTPGTLSIPSGRHSITIWDREDGTEIDKIVVSSSSTPPTGVGPAESAQIGGTVAAPSFSPAAGTYDTAQTVTISSSTTGATIRYTIDGSTPSSTAGTIYSGPVVIGATTTLKAIAYLTGMTDSSVTSGTYALTAFQPNASGDFVLEAEHSTVNAGGTDTWTLVTDASASGTTSNNALQSLPNDGTAYATFDPSAAHVDYQINVPSAGNYYVHLRDYGATSTDDSVYVSIDDGSTTQTVTAGRTLDWKSSPATLSIPAGVHRLTVWDREDGIEIDKIVVSTNSAPPTGAGPAESTRN